MPSTGDLIGQKYRIVRPIGEGGMGAVYEARHEMLGSSVALKFLHSDLAQRPGLGDRFMQEARVSATVQSPHVTRVTDVDRASDGSIYLVMELLLGESLQQRLDRQPVLPRDEAIDIALQTLAGLEAAHAVGVVHRDLKPDNVFLMPTAGGPVVKLLDFGIAKLRQTSEFRQSLTRPGAVMGTPEYMAPEQAFAADQVDARADIYSCGVILYEMLSGHRPVEGNDAGTIIEQVIRRKATPLLERDPRLPSGLADLVGRALAPNPDERPRTAREFRLELARFAGALSHAGRLAAVEVLDAWRPSLVPQAPPAVASNVSAPPQVSPPSQIPSPPAAPSHVPLPAQAASPVAPGSPPEWAAPATHGPTTSGAIRTEPPSAGVPPWRHPTTEPDMVNPSTGTASFAAPQSVWLPVPGPSRQRPRRRALAWGLLGTLTVAGAATAAWFLVVHSARSEPPPLAPPAPIPLTTIEAQTERSSPEAEERGEGPALRDRRSSSRRTTPAGRADAGSGTAPPAGFPPFSWPSAIPPIPSALPPGLIPQIPGLPLPPPLGSQPASPEQSPAEGSRHM